MKLLLSLAALVASAAAIDGRAQLCSEIECADGKFCAYGETGPTCSKGENPCNEQFCIGGNRCIAMLECEGELCKASSSCCPLCSPPKCAPLEEGCEYVAPYTEDRCGCRTDCGTKKCEDDDKDVCKDHKCGDGKRCIKGEDGEAKCVCNKASCRTCENYPRCKLTSIFDDCGCALQCNHNCTTCDDLDCGEEKCFQPELGGAYCREPLPPCLTKECKDSEECKVVNGEATCVSTNPCDLVDCKEDFICKVMDGEATCVKPDACHTVKCVSPKTCIVNGDGEAECVCTKRPCMLPPCAAPPMGCRYDGNTTKDECGCPTDCGKLKCKSCEDMECEHGTICVEGTDFGSAQCVKDPCNLMNCKDGYECKVNRESGEGECEKCPPCAIPGCARPKPGCEYGTPDYDDCGCQLNCGKLICEEEEEACKEVACIGTHTCRVNKETKKGECVGNCNLVDCMDGKVCRVNDETLEAECVADCNPEMCPQILCAIEEGCEFVEPITKDKCGCQLDCGKKVCSCQSLNCLDDQVCKIADGEEVCVSEKCAEKECFEIACDIREGCKFVGKHPRDECGCMTGCPEVECEDDCTKPCDVMDCPSTDKPGCKVVEDGKEDSCGCPISCPVVECKCDRSCPRIGCPMPNSGCTPIDEGKKDECGCHIECPSFACPSTPGLTTDAVVPTTTKEPATTQEPATTEEPSTSTKRLCSLVCEDSFVCKHLANEDKCCPAECPLVKCGLPDKYDSSQCSPINVPDQCGCNGCGVSCKEVVVKFNIKFDTTTTSQEDIKSALEEIIKASGIMAKFNLRFSEQSINHRHRRATKEAEVEIEFTEDVNMGQVEALVEKIEDEGVEVNGQVLEASGASTTGVNASSSDDDNDNAYVAPLIAVVVILLITVAVVIFVVMRMKSGKQEHQQAFVNPVYDTPQTASPVNSDTMC